ncbi:MAG: hypothetical protein LBU55_04230 [Elusimicrobiota bacterium]|jgi:type II secretory pathway pseudopilin PulG|nr:hypothetical protein [Elusimicrobiota bacterium]
MKIKRVAIVEVVLALAIIVFTVCLLRMRFARRIDAAKEIANVKSLASLRNAIACYYIGNSYSYPTENISKEIVEKGYIARIPYVYIHEKPKQNKIVVSDFNEHLDEGWGYQIYDNESETGRKKGEIWINASDKNLSVL